MLITGVWCVAEKTKPCYSGGSAAAAVGILFVLALVLSAPTLILDDSADKGGEPSAMRILSLAIVLTFCVLMLRSAGWRRAKLCDCAISRKSPLPKWPEDFHQEAGSARCEAALQAGFPIGDFRFQTQNARFQIQNSRFQIGHFPSSSSARTFLSTKAARSTPTSPGSIGSSFSMLMMPWKPISM